MFGIFVNMQVGTRCLAATSSQRGSPPVQGPMLLFRELAAYQRLSHWARWRLLESWVSWVFPTVGRLELGGHGLVAIIQGGLGFQPWQPVRLNEE